MGTQQYSVIILNGPNLNLLGTREPEVYGSKTLDAIAAECDEHAGEIGLTIDFRQTNDEGEMISILHEARTTCDGVIINPAAYGHTSIALHDALKAINLPAVEVHISNVFKRESFRHTSYVSPVVNGVISGFGSHGYILALDAMRTILDDTK